MRSPGARFINGLSGIALLTLVVCSPACQRSARTKIIPEHLFGVWKTNNIRYEDRFFEITRAMKMVVGTGDDNVETYAISGIEQDESKGPNFYRLYYLNEASAEYTFSFFYYPTDNGVIIFANQKDLVWDKQRQ